LPVFGFLNSFWLRKFFSGGKRDKPLGGFPGERGFAFLRKEIF